MTEADLAAVLNELKEQMHMISMRSAQLAIENSKLNAENRKLKEEIEALKPKAEKEHENADVAKAI